MLLVEILRVLSENRVDHITLCVDKVQTDVLNVVTGWSYSKYCSLKDCIPLYAIENKSFWKIFWRWCG